MYNIKNRYSVNSLSKLVKTKQSDGSYIFELQKILDKHNLFLNRIYSPTLCDIKKRYTQSAIILFQRRVEGPHFSCISKITKKYIYLTNIYCDQAEKYVEEKKFIISCILV
jgi:hypothetical protein